MNAWRRIQLVSASADYFSNRELGMLVCKLLAGPVSLKVAEI